MKINFNNTEIGMMDVQISEKNSQNKTHKGHSINAGKNPYGVNVDLSHSLGRKVTSPMGDLFGNGEKSKGGKTLTELQMEAGNIDVAVNQDYQTVLSNTMSAEDYARASKEGFDYASMDPEDVVTIQDRVKAEVAKSGEVIIGYNDNLDSAVMEKALGSATLAQSIEAKFSEVNLPITEENIEDIARSYELLSQIEQPNEEAIVYMVENELPPTIWNLYLAENSNEGKILNSEPSANIDLEAPENQKMAKQIEKMLINAGRNEEDGMLQKGMESAQWLLDHQLPVTVATIENYEAIRSVEFPVTEDNFVAAVAAAISQGEKAVYSDLTQQKDIYTLAAEYENKYFSEDLWKMTEGNLVARRQLEEVRLSMTAEVNVKLLESGFSIDTAPMEELIDALMQAEAQVAKRYFGKTEENNSNEDIAGVVDKYRLMNATNNIVSDIASSPADIIGGFITRQSSEVTLPELHKEGAIRRDVYEKAGESYEALSTAPRYDLGDSIKKAFNNIPELVKNLGLEANSENIRAARILGYNHMEITSESIDVISRADALVSGVINKMTPASVLNMIREGVNPLEMSIEELSQYFDSNSESGYERESKSYSEFLYALDMQGDITEEERESFIGIYRLIDKIEKSDGSVIGSLINEQAQISFSNLLSAVRSNRFKKMDLRIDDSFGGIADIIRSGKSITDQISAAYQSERQLEELKDLREAAEVSSRVTTLLKGNEIPESAENLAAAMELISSDKNLFDELNGYDKKNDRVKNLARKAEEALSSDEIAEGLDEVYEEAIEYAQELTFEVDSYIDVKALALIHRQLGMAREIASKEDIAKESEYFVPMEIGDEVAKVHLTFKNSNSEEATLDIATVYSDREIEVHFELKSENISGYIVQNSEEELQNNNALADIFFETLTGSEVSEELTVSKLLVVNKNSNDRRNQTVLKDTISSKEAGAESSDGSKRKTLMQIAKLFLKTVGNM